MVGLPMNRSKPAVSPDVALRLLAEQRRRKVLRFLANNGEKPVPLDNLAAKITDGESTGNEEEMDSYDSVVTSLYHSHLPKLQEAGLVEFDRQDSTVRYRRHEDVEGLLDHVDTSFE